jgi:putative PEP-CTERM system histidine kinase
MDGPAFSIGAWSYGIAAVAYALLLLRFAANVRSGLRGAMLVGAFMATTLWAGCDWLLSVSRWSSWMTTASVLDVVRAAAWQGFLLLILRQPTARDRGSAYDRLWPPVVVLVLTTLGALVARAYGFPVPGDAGRFALFGQLALSILGLVLVEQLWRGTAEESRWGIKPLCLGLGALWAFDVYHFADALLFSRYDADLWVARGFVHALASPLLAVAALRGRADHGSDVFAVRVSRQVIFHTATLVAAGAYLLFMAAAGYYVRYFGGQWGAAVQIALLFGALLVLGVVMVSASARAKVRVLISKHFFTYRYDYREEWLRFTGALSATSSQTEMGVQILRALGALVESPAGALWTREPGGTSFAQTARWNMPENPGIEPVESELSDFLVTSGWVVNLEEYRSAPGRYGDLVLPDWMQDVPNAWLVVPLLVGSELTGFAVLATARTKLDINWEVNDLLKTAARQAASFLGQMYATEALLEARKFDAFNRMSAFVVHDLKNIVAQLSLLLKNAERHRANPEFQKDMLETIGHSVERMKQLMLQLREGNTPVDAPQGVELAPLIRRIAKAKTGQDPVPEMEFDAEVATRGHEEKLERVIGHLVQNAVDATEPSGRVWIKLSRLGSEAVVEVGDTGHGMAPEFVRDRLFRPFQTTKQAGMGIGAYESFQYVRDLGGRVEVDSAPGAGTRIRLFLPLFGAGSATASGPVSVDPVADHPENRKAPA